jgi:signal transduction histidine kinase
MAEAASQDPRRLADFLRERKTEILEHWARQVMRVRGARNLSRPLLLDHLPHFLDDLAHYVDDLRHGHHKQPPEENPRIHALERLEVGYDLAEVVEEYAILRGSITELAYEQHAPALRSGELPRLHEAIDQAIASSVVRYTEARERTLRALDRISQTALEHPDVESLLPNTLLAFLETTPAVDSVSLLLREDGELKVRAAVGYPDDGNGPVGRVCHPKNFGSQVERARVPMMVRDGSAEADFAGSPTLAPGTHALYGVPLILGGDVLGVAVMGSRTTYEFSDEDRFLFRTMVNRAATLIAQARLDAALRARAAELEAVVQSIPEAVYVGDTNGIRSANRAALKQLGYSSVAEMNRDLGGLSRDIEVRDLDGKPVPYEQQVFARALRGEQAVAEVRVRRKETREELVLRSSAAPIRLGEKTIGAVAVNSDITRRMREEAQLREALDYRDKMLGVLSHDLRNPLGVIVTSATLAQTGALDERQHRALGHVLRNAKRIDRMVHDLLDYTRSRSGSGLLVNRREGDFFAMVQQAADNIQMLHPGRILALHREGELRINFDSDRALQVVSNLLTNAYRYSKPGTPVDVRVRGVDEGVWLDVHNQGEPIPARVLPRLFEAFERGNAVDGQGLGLGLYIVKEIVEAHGGRVHVTSTAADGTTFSVLWPR